MLLNEFLKEHGKVRQLEDTVTQQQTAVAAQWEQIETLTTALQKLSDTVTLNESKDTAVAAASIGAGLGVPKRQGRSTEGRSASRYRLGRTGGSVAT